MTKLVPRLLIAAAVIGGGIYLALARPWASTADKVKLTTVTVTRGNIAAQVTATGTLSARGTVQVGAQVSGRVLEIHADWNDKVKKGQIIAKLDDSVLKAQIEQSSAGYALATANQKKAEVAVLDAERQLARQKGLAAQSLVASAVVEQAEVVLDTARASLAAAKAQVAQAAASLKQVRTNLGYATIYSPVDGVVLSRAVELGQTVAASLQAPILFTIAEDLARMQIDTAVAEADVGRLKEGMKATFTVDAFSGKTFEGLVRQIRNSPTTTQGVVTYDAVIDVDNPELALKPGMTANVTFVLEQVNDVVKIPNAALRLRLTPDQLRAMAEYYGLERPGGRQGSNGRSGNGGSGAPSGNGGSGGAPSGNGGGMAARFGDRRPVWKLENGKPKMVLIKPGLTDGSSTQLVEGQLAPQDQLITEISGLPAARRKIGAF